MDEKSTIQERFLDRAPPFLHDPSVWVPLVVGLYVLFLGLCLTGALKRQETSIRELRREQKKVYTQQMRDSDDETPVKSQQMSSRNGKKRTGRKGVDLGDWNNIGCR
ncbi:hypothetical protein BKA64DRAFT_646673 [Cadophora sp. MPI-SDFR-AT-0126]|nr:hypothetical protein BKA64DRAFT_646673 [Leotiomycetes sp. MPI-SDFR-AT-0126]